MFGSCFHDRDQSAQDPQRISSFSCTRRRFFFFLLLHTHAHARLMIKYRPDRHPPLAPAAVRSSHTSKHTKNIFSIPIHFPTFNFNFCDASEKTVQRAFSCQFAPKVTQTTSTIQHAAALPARPSVPAAARRAAVATRARLRLRAAGRARAAGADGRPAALLALLPRGRDALDLRGLPHHAALPARLPPRVPLARRAPTHRRALLLAQDHAGACAFLILFL